MRKFIKQDLGFKKTDHIQERFREGGRTETVFQLEGALGHGDQRMMNPINYTLRYR